MDTKLEMEENRKCLLCCDNYTEDEAVLSFHSSKKSALDKHLEVIFLLRKVLEVPLPQLANYLEGCPNVEGWIRVCTRCEELVKQSRLVFEQLLEVNRKWMECKQKIIKVVKKTVKEEMGDLDDYQNLVVDISQNTRLFVQNHKYDSVRNPFLSGDRKAQQLQQNLMEELKVEQTLEEAYQWEADISNEIVDSPPVVDDDYFVSDNSSDNEEPLSPQLPKKSKKIKKRPPSRKPASVKSVSCHVCNLTLSSPRSLKQHLYTKHSIGTLRFQCSKCHKMFRCNLDLQRHLPSCSKSATDQPTRSRSDEYFMPPGNNFQIKCPVLGCPLTWPIVSSYRVHLKTEHTEEERAALPKAPKILECLTCGKLFNVKYAAVSHAYRHDKTLKKQKICDVCGLAYPTNYLLNIHKRASMACKKLQGLTESEATVICDICGARFSTPGLLGTHIKHKHEDNYKHRCQICGKGFKVKPRLAEHLSGAHQVETKELELVCPVEGCGRIFYRKSRWREHQLSNHSQGEPEHRCEHCGKGFHVKRCLQQHVSVVHLGSRKK